MWRVLCVVAIAACGDSDGKLPDAAPPVDTAIDAAMGSAEFVVNSTFTGDQFLTNDFEAVGLQTAAVADGIWTVAFRENCNPTSSCTVLARRFDSLGRPVHSELAAGETQFPVSTRLTTSGAIPAVAASGTTTLVLWDFIDTVGGGQGVSCRAINQQGASIAAQLDISTDSADVVTVSPLPNSNFVATWQTFISPNQVVRGVIVTPGCVTLAGQNPYTVSTASGTFGARRSHAASNGDTVLYTWIVDGQVHIRTGPLSGTPLGTEVLLVTKTATQEIDHVRVVPWGTGFAVATRWAAASGTGPGKLEVYRVSTTGAIDGAPILITDKSGSDFASDKAFGLARRGDDTVMVVWHQCDAGPGSCDVYGRALHSDGALVGQPMVLSDTTASDQINPTIIAVGESFAVAWNDSSATVPDESGGAVRARIILPNL